MNGMEKERQSFLPFLFLCDPTERAGGFLWIMWKMTAKMGQNRTNQVKACARKCMGRSGPD